MRRWDAGALGALIATTLAIRLGFAALLPSRYYSIDIHIWESVTKVLLAGGNPYATTSLLYYPPFWMQILWVLGKLSIRTHITLAHLIQLFLIGIDVLIVVIAYMFMKALGAGRSAFWIALVGIALNPISIFMSVEHGNFDSMLGLFALAAVFAIVVWNRKGVPSTWLLACMSIGLGILAKTVPLILAPMLLVRWRETDWASRVVGLALVVGPALVGVSVLYVLSPQPVAAEIFHYRSAAGYFGISGLLNLAGGLQATTRYSQVYPLLALTVVVIAALAIARARVLSEQAIVLGSLLLLMWVPPLGSGYGAQYIGWFLPLAVVLFAMSTGALRISLAIFGAAALVTYSFEYAFVPLQDAATRDMFSPQSAQTLFRLPLFFAYLGVLVVGVLTLLGTTNVRLSQRRSRSIGEESR
ncbi:MAG: glycosyltransferase 87 family protein [Candidatus Dormibacterales bacterium]